MQCGRSYTKRALALLTLQGNSNGMVILVRANLSGLTWELVLRAIMVVRTHLIFLFGRPLWAIGASRSQVRWGDRCAIARRRPRRPSQSHANLPC